MALMIVLGTLVLFTLSIYLLQRRMIYFPSRYDEAELRLLPPSMLRIEYAISSGRQVAFYLPPRVSSAKTAEPLKLWLLFSGNASRALNWLDFLLEAPPDAGYLMIDYPGYGACEGHPTRETIRESVRAAFSSLAVRLNLDEIELLRDVNVMGHSLGAAAALDWATDRPVKRLILISPFTTLHAMARRTVGWPLCNLLIDRFDNPARLDELALQVPRPSVTIIHGDSDEIVPVGMSRALAASHPDWIRYTEIQNGDHNWILESARDEIIATMEEK